MGHHTFDPSRADKLERPGRRFRFLSAEELRWALDLDASDRVADLGSGTGFYTDVIASQADTVYAVDLQPEMHEYYREKGVPESVELVTTGVGDLPFDDGTIDVAFSTMTYHEFASADALAEIHRVLESGGRFVIVDWAATGPGESGPPLAERYGADEIADALREAEFSIEHVAVRSETVLVIATAE
ncbi:class I SAM-dependent methyltransferase [Natrarchaeobius halalkaliphilus]|uniref:Class I SAM-dependent methyltransferase n=1 Tax=Natrarchaeobius halalkaliphilus TaxID=1679091 RepID=A0A3N6LP13_9EURY|nr:class I SAM-dependent methyltransferase [Natrarchaeobius halalkaliphilus]RQG87967.1 class I SAM-dependent methyltransferase [Natrarchaeobius halalkaliphilus]